MRVACSSGDMAALELARRTSGASETNSSADFAHGAGLAVAPAIVDADILPDGPTQLRQALRESRQPRVSFRIVRSERGKHADAAHPRRLLRARRKWPCCRRAADERDELAPPHSITSSARADKVGGTSRPSTFAVLRLMTNSNLVGCTTGRSEGCSPLRTRAV